MKRKVLVAVSGGVDSAVAAWMLKQDGFAVTGVCFDFASSSAHASAKDLGLLEELLDIRILHYDARNEFREKVVRYMVSMHQAGRTPSPCTVCNPQVKWKLLAELATRDGFDYHATGHYIRIVSEKGIPRIYRATDREKDQSYFLWGLSRSLSENTLCPLGSFLKNDIIRIASSNGWDSLAMKRESTGLCFAADTKYTTALQKFSHDLLSVPGDITDREGRLIGKHRGYAYYTIGQKKDLDLLHPDRDLCVSKIDPEKNRLTVTHWKDLYTHEFLIGETVFADEAELNNGMPVQTRVRGFGLNPEGQSWLFPAGEGLFRVRLENPAWAVSSGQPAVFYQGEKLLGGGFVI